MNVPYVCLWLGLAPLYFLIATIFRAYLPVVALGQPIDLLIGVPGGLVASVALAQIGRYLRRKSKDPAVSSTAFNEQVKLLANTTNVFALGFLGAALVVPWTTGAGFSPLLAIYMIIAIYCHGQALTFLSSLKAN